MPGIAGRIWWSFCCCGHDSRDGKYRIDSVRNLKKSFPKPSSRVFSFPNWKLIRSCSSLIWIFRFTGSSNRWSPSDLRITNRFSVQARVTDTGYSRLLKEKHIRLVAKQGDIIFSGIAFNMADKWPLVQSGQPLDIAYTLDVNEWNGEKNLQLKIRDIKPA